MLKSFLNYLFYGFMLAVIVALYINSKTLSQMSNFEFIKVLLVGSLIITPIMSLLIYVINFAGIPLVKDFIEGSLLRKILIILIVITLVKMRF